MKINGSQILVEVLVEQGTDVIFGYPGGAVLNIYDALYKNSDRIKHIITAHEQGAAHAADGYARATGKTGVVLATSGPGATNLVTGIATAFMDSVPMVAITGNVASDLIGLDSFQEVYIAGITMPITKHNFVVRNVEELADTLREAFRIAVSDRPGPVLVDITKDVTAAECEFTPAGKVVPVKHDRFTGEDIEKVAGMINNSERPVVLYGGGVISSNASKELEELLEKGNLPCTNTLMGTAACKGGPLDLHMIGHHGSRSANMAVAESDLVIAVGTRFSDRVATNKKKFATGAKVVHIDVDPAEINKNVSSAYSLIGDVAHVLKALAPKLENKPRKQWTDRLRALQSEDAKPVHKDGVLQPFEIIQAVCDHMGKDGIMVTDVGQHQMWAAQYCKNLSPRAFLTSGGLGTMGFGYGASVGAKTAFPERTVMHITSDGCFHMNMNELCTAVTYKLPIISVVLNNSVLGMVRQWQTLFYGERYSCTTLDRETDYVKLAEAFGGVGYRCTTLEELNAALDKAVKSDKPVVIDAVIDRNEMVLPMIPAGKTIDDIVTMH